MPITLTRSLLVILIPGGVATIPWLLTVAMIFEKDLVYYTKYSVLFNIICFALAVIVGMIFEGFNTFTEDNWDEKREADYSVKKNWYDYLAFSFKNEPVGFRYISNKVTTMYFELAMMLAAPCFFLGAMVLITHSNILTGFYYAIVMVSFALLSVGSFLYFRWQAKKTHEVLCVTRIQINQRLNQSKTI